MADGARLRLVFVSLEFPPRYGGGIGTCVRTLSAALARRGHEVTVVTPGNEGDSREDHEGGGSLRVVRLGELDGCGGAMRAWWSWSDRAAAWLEHNASDADLVEFPDYRGEALAFLARRAVAAAAVGGSGGDGGSGGGGGNRGGGPVCLVRLHTPLAVLNRYNASRRRERALEAMEIEALLASDGVVSSSHALTAEVRESVPELGEVWFSRYGVEDDGGDGAAPAPTGSATDVVYVGRLEERKGVATLIRAAGPFLRACGDATLHLVGGDTEWSPAEPSTRAHLETLIDPEHRPRIVFHGALDPSRVRDVLRGARICVFPSHFEAGPYTCLEAMAMGRSVIGTDRGGMREMIEDGIGGLLARAADPDDLAAKLIGLFGRSDAELRTMGERARRRASERYSPAAAAEEAEGVYRSAIERARRRAAAPAGAAPTALAASLAEAAALERELRSRTARVAELESAHERLWDELQSTARERDEAAAESRRLAEAWEDLRARVIELESARDRLWDETQRLTNERDAMSAEAQRLAREWESVAARVRELEAEVAQAHTLADQSARDRAELMQRLDALQHAISASQTQPVFRVLAKAGLVKRIGAAAASEADRGPRHG